MATSGNLKTQHPLKQLYQRAAGSGRVAWGSPLRFLKNMRGAVFTFCAVSTFCVAAPLVLAGCAIIYPEVQTGTRLAKDGQALDPPPPDDLYYLYIEGASIPPKTPGGLEWEGGAPDPFAKLIVNDVDLLRTPTQSHSREPSWPDQKRGNYRIVAGSRIFVEVWDDNPVTNKPICRAAVREIQNMRGGGVSEIWCDSGARVQLHVEPAKGLIGLGLYYESRGTEGVRVTRVVANSPAARAGLSGGDQILRINGKDVKTLDPNQVRSAINEKAQTGLELDVWYQNGKRHLVTIKEGALYPLPEDELELPRTAE